MTASSEWRLTQQPLVTTDTDAFGLPGVVLVVDPEDAESLGAFPDNALGVEDAWDANADEER